jgi:hypothetical protein
MAKGRDSMRKVIFAILIVLCVLAVAMPAIAEVGRYQAIPFTSNAIFILDTKSGHTWIWVYISKPDKNTYFLDYGGKLRPGAKMGDLIDFYTESKKDANHGLKK